MKKRIRKNNQDKIIEKLLADWRVRKEIAVKDLKVFFPIYFPQYLKYETPDFHEEIFNVLEDESNKLFVLIAFRGSAKSTLITTAYVLWAILGIQQKRFVVIHGRTEREARQYLLNIKYFIYFSY
jgi:hypothetical protein